MNKGGQKKNTRREGRQHLQLLSYIHYSHCLAQLETGRERNSFLHFDVYLVKPKGCYLPPRDTRVFSTLMYMPRKLVLLDEYQQFGAFSQFFENNFKKGNSWKKQWGPS